MFMHKQYTLCYIHYIFYDRNKFESKGMNINFITLDNINLVYIRFIWNALTTVIDI